MLGISAAEAERAGRRIGEVETAGDAVAVGPDVRGTIGITVAIFRPVPDRIEPELRREIASERAAVRQHVECLSENGVLIDSGQRTIDFGRRQLVEELSGLVRRQADVERGGDIGDLLRIAELSYRVAARAPRG